MLATDRQDPILAAWIVDTGRVVAITSGLGGWAADWLTWDRWPEFAASLVNLIAVSNEGAVRFDNESHRSVMIEIGPRDDARQKVAQLVLPYGPPLTIPLDPVAPGLYRADLPFNDGSRYTLVWDDAGELRRHSFIGGQQPVVDRSDPPTARRFVEMGLIREWSGELGSDLSARLPVKQILIAVALFGLLFVVAAERVPVAELRARFSRPSPASRP